MRSNEITCTFIAQLECLIYVKYCHFQKISSDVASKQPTLEQLEKEGRELAQGFRSRESTSVKTKLATLRRQWETLCMRARDESSTLTTSVSHWQVYVRNLQTILPWLDRAEKYLSEEAGRSPALEEARNQYDQHQVFQQELDEHRDIYDHLMEEASHMMDRPEVGREAEGLRKRWDRMETASDDRSQLVLRALEAWTGYTEDVGEIQRVEDRLDDRLSEEPNIHSIHAEVLSKQLGSYKVK